MDKLFDELAQKQNDVTRPRILKVQGRELKLSKACGSIADCTFEELCDRPLGASDYLEMCKKFDTVFIRQIPQFNMTKRSQARRFITLIDAFYDHKVLYRRVGPCPQRRSVPSSPPSPGVEEWRPARGRRQKCGVQQQKKPELTRTITSWTPAEHAEGEETGELGEDSGQDHWPALPLRECGKARRRSRGHRRVAQREQQEGGGYVCISGLGVRILTISVHQGGSVVSTAALELWNPEFKSHKDNICKEFVRVVCSAETPLQSLFMQKLKDSVDVESRILLDDLEISQDSSGGLSMFTGEEEVFAFQRTLSRLTEMQTDQYWRDGDRSQN
ncbi:unnamed protein product [Ranitomeya imitator]|uniref:Uncharacterized protein n=1 Tax=Ranitomeya imitator TaxID=111125 RepID=A0ABN9LBM6_9NEOB|nr:unnamed protein product [Ranitomeya imitator]